MDSSIEFLEGGDAALGEGVGDLCGDLGGGKCFGKVADKCEAVVSSRSNFTARTWSRTVRLLSHNGLSAVLW